MDDLESKARYFGLYDLRGFDTSRLIRGERCGREQRRLSDVHLFHGIVIFISKAMKKGGGDDRGITYARSLLILASEKLDGQKTTCPRFLQMS